MSAINRGSVFFLAASEKSSVVDDDYTRQPYQRRPTECSGRYDVQAGVALPYASRGADV